jgi:hypothetical protein
MTERFNTAVTKLYTAYHNGSLDAFDCMHCAVGNLCDSKTMWVMHFVNGIHTGKLPQREPGLLYIPPDSKDYSEKELIQIEYLFLCEWAKAKSKDGHNKEIQFNGLCAVIEYLAELDGISNPFNFENLFSDSTEIAERELQTALITQS